MEDDKELNVQFAAEDRSSIESVAKEELDKISQVAKELMNVFLNSIQSCTNEEH